MAKLKLGLISDDKPVRLTIELPAQIHRDLIDYSAALAQETPSASPMEPAKLVAPMLARFMATDRAFAAARRGRSKPAERPAASGEPVSSCERETS